MFSIVCERSAEAISLKIKAKCPVFDFLDLVGKKKLNFSQKLTKERKKF